MDRRRFLGTTAAAGLVGTLGAPARAQEPKKGGRLRAAIAEGSTSDSLDPATYTDIYMISVGFATHSTLTEIAPDGTLTGDAAESWEGDDDATVWTFRLRDGVTFSDGRKLTAEDVIASIGHHIGEDSTSAVKSAVSIVSGMEAVDPRTVRITLSGPNADLPYIMSDYHLLLMPANPDGSANWQDYVGTGGYVLESFEPGVRTVMRRRDDYWKEGRAHFDELELLYVSDVAARQNALATGEVDVMSRVDLKTVNLLERRGGLVVEETTGTKHHTAPMLVDTPPFDDVDLRRAIFHAIDRQELLDKIMFGRGSMANDHPIAPTMPFYNAELPQRTQDLDRARFHAKKAGYGGEELVLKASDAAYAGAVDASVLMSEHLAAAGINMRVERVPSDGYWSNVWLKEPWCACYWGGRPTCDWMFTTAYKSGVAWNDTNFSNERFDQLLLEGRRTTEDAKRADIYGEMQRILHEQGGTLNWAFANYVWARSDRLAHGPEMAANYDLDGGRYVERWWFA